VREPADFLQHVVVQDIERRVRAKTLVCCHTYCQLLFKAAHTSKKKLSAEFAPRRSCVAVHIASCFSKLRTYMLTHETHMHGIPVARDLLQISYRLAPHTCTCTSGMFTFYREHILHIYTHARHPCCKLLLEADIRTKLSYMLPETELQTCYTDASFCFIHDTRIHHTCCSSFSKMLNPKP
jgi:hypothetical protein